VSVERERVRKLVEEELRKRLAPTHPALALLHFTGEEEKESDPENPRPCVIEPDRPCYRSGYCKRLGY
jgi:hypothetical protein